MFVFCGYLNCFCCIWTVVGGNDYEFTVKVRYLDSCAVRRLCGLTAVVLKVGLLW